MEATILIPTAGEGSRFRKVGFLKPKPMIDVGGKPMIMWVIENILPKSFKLNAKIVVVIRRDQDVQFQVASQLQGVIPGVEIVYAEQLTEGAACTCLLAKTQINNERPLFIINSDQFIDWDADTFWQQVSTEAEHADGNILCFKHPAELNDTKWSYAQVGPDDCVVDVREKEVSSDNSTVGAYFWQRGADFVSAAEEMIGRNLRVNGEFYVAPAYNVNIERGQKIRLSFCRKMWGLGIPADLSTFLSRYVRPRRKNEAARSVQCPDEFMNHDDNSKFDASLELLANLQRLKFISNGGSIRGPDPVDRNSPKSVIDAIEAGFDVKIDVWFFPDTASDSVPPSDILSADGKSSKFGHYFLGHERPTHEVDYAFLEMHSNRLWIQCRNEEALQHFARMPSFECFRHVDDRSTLTSRRNIWTGESSLMLGDRNIAAMISDPKRLIGCNLLGICSDDVEALRQHRDDLLTAAQIKMCSPESPPAGAKGTYRRIALVVFDLDGVLVESKELHYEAMNQALDNWLLRASTYTQKMSLYSKTQ